MAGSLKLSDSPSGDTQRPTSGLIGKAGKPPSQTTLHRRSRQVKFGKLKPELKSERFEWHNLICGFNWNLKDMEIAADALFSVTCVGSKEDAVAQLVPLAMKLFHKMVDTSTSFHLTLINVCFSNLRSATSRKSSITSFFAHSSTSQTPRQVL